ncbi:hypothetical protein GIB67_017204 [Kingdonia uniflora]|uniref:Uncharacterized protein n=1 Tax=Kingdonia uniflora TaxID=39325 RepID=A0A7J7NKE7_9MAGN|nr:hypothetical protein GIB67_017204 [Kingdonia uniflora]
MAEGKAILTVVDVLSMPLPVSQSTKRNVRLPVAPARQSSPVTRGEATTQEIAKSIFDDVAENLKVAPIEVEKSSLKRKGTRKRVVTELNLIPQLRWQLELKYCSMAAMDPKQLDTEYYEHTFALSMLLKGVQKCLEHKSQKFGALIVRFKVQSTRLKKFEDQSARVKELEAELKLENDQRTKKARTAAELTTKYSELEIERLRKTNSELERSLSRVRDSYSTDSERGLKEAYVELLKERGVVPDPARVMFLAQEVRNRHSLEARKCFAQAGVSVVWGDVEPLSDTFGFM